MSYPRVDRRAAAAAGAALRRLGYAERAILDMLGEEAYAHGRDELPLDERRLARTRLGTAVRALFLQLPASREALAAALGVRAVDGLRAIGLFEGDAELRCRARILPVGDLLVASDDNPPDGGADPPDYVAAYTLTSRLCDCLTPRLRGVRALDVGTGSGVQALLAARHAASVVATDVNPRALAFTALNAALNGLDNVETRTGSLFDAAAGERFDLVTCNPPYVVSPENRFAYRDGGLRGDELTRRVVLAAAEHLAPGGFATVLGSWVGAGDADADARPLAWANGLGGCDAWILPVWEADPLDHAAAWNRQPAGGGEELGAALDDWTGYLRELGAGWVSEGAILLHRRDGGRHGARVDRLDDETLEQAGGQVRRAFAARARLASLPRADGLLDLRVALAMPVRVECDLEPRRSGPAAAAARVVLDDGTRTAVETAPAAAELVARLDGRAALRRLLARASPRERRAALRLVRELAELGALSLPDE